MAKKRPSTTVSPRNPARTRTDTRQLGDLASIGPAMLGDFRVLGISTVSQLKRQSAEGLYDKLCRLTGTRHDPCVLDSFACAIAQARNPRLPKAQCDWWYWSAKRKAAAPKAKKKAGPRRRTRS